MSNQLETRLIIEDDNGDRLTVEVYKYPQDDVKFVIDDVYLTKEDADALCRFLETN